LRIALNPLLGNAIKYSRRGGSILVSANVGDDYVEVGVKDNGPGIASEEVESLFAWNSHERNEFSPRIRSSGLGLSMAKRIIELQGGRLWIVSDRSGTAVRFRMPTANYSHLT